MIGLGLGRSPSAGTAAGIPEPSAAVRRPARHVDLCRVALTYLSYRHVKEEDPRSIELMVEAGFEVRMQKKTAQDVLETDDAFWQDAWSTPLMEKRYSEPMFTFE